RELNLLGEYLLRRLVSVVQQELTQRRAPQAGGAGDRRLFLGAQAQLHLRRLQCRRSSFWHSLTSLDYSRMMSVQCPYTIAGRTRCRVASTNMTTPRARMSAATVRRNTGSGMRRSMRSPANVPTTTPAVATAISGQASPSTSARRAK